VDVPGKVSVKSRAGWGDWVERKSIQFSTGFELNDRTKSFDYEAFSNYAVVWFDERQVAIIKLNELLITGMRFEKSALSLYQRFGELTGEDKQGRQWKFCLHSYCF
jgi:hypothetical protein